MSRVRVLVTGATGFVGANLTRRLLRDGHDVHLLVRPEYAAWRIQDIARDLNIHQVLLADPDVTARAVREIAPEWAFHLAAEGAYSWQNDTGKILETNVTGTANLLQACAQAGCGVFVNTGSSSEYGFKDHAPAEDEIPEPNSVYAVGKACATMLCRYMARQTGAHIPTLRLYSVYGPWEDPRRLIPQLIECGMRGQFPPMARPDTARDYVYADDVVDAYMLAATQTDSPAPGAVYNVGTGVQTTLRQIAGLARRLLNIPAEPEWGGMAGRAWDTAVWVADSSKIQRELGWRPKHTLDEGLGKTVEWFRQRNP